MQDRGRRADLERLVDTSNPGAGSILGASWPKLDAMLQSYGRLNNKGSGGGASAAPSTSMDRLTGQIVSRYPTSSLSNRMVPHLDQPAFFGQSAWRSTSLAQNQNPFLAGGPGNYGMPQQYLDRPDLFESYYPDGYPSQTRRSSREPSPWTKKYSGSNQQMPDSSGLMQDSPRYDPLSPEYQDSRYQLNDRELAAYHHRRQTSSPESSDQSHPAIMQSAPTFQEMENDPTPSQATMQQSMAQALPPPLQPQNEPIENAMAVDVRRAAVKRLSGIEADSVTPKSRARLDRDGNELVPMSDYNDWDRLRRSRDRTKRLMNTPLGPVTARAALNDVSLINTPSAIEAAQSLNKGSGVADMVVDSAHKTLYPMEIDDGEAAGPNLMVIRPPQVADNQGSHPVISKMADITKKRANLLRSGVSREQMSALGVARQAYKDEIKMKTGEVPVPIVSSTGEKLRAIGMSTFGQNPMAIPITRTEQEALFRGKTDAPAIDWYPTQRTIQERRNLRRPSTWLSGAEALRQLRRNFESSMHGGNRPNSSTKMVADAPSEKEEGAAEPVNVNLTLGMKPPSIKQQLVSGALQNASGVASALMRGLSKWGSGAARAGNIYSAANRNMLLKLTGDAPMVVKQDGGTSKLVGDAPGEDSGAVAEPGMVAMDTDAGHAQDDAVAAMRLSHFFGPTFAEMLVSEIRIKSSYAGEARSKDDLLRNVILQNTSLQWAFNTTDLTTTTVVPGLTLYPMFIVYPSSGSTNGWARNIAPQVHFKIDEEAAENCVPLMSTFSVDNLVGAVRSGGNMTAFTSVLRLNTSFFSADELSRFFSLTIGSVNNRTGYGFESSILKLILYGMTYNPVLGDEMAQLVSHFAFLPLLNGVARWHAEDWFPFQLDGDMHQLAPVEHEIAMRVVDHVDFIRHISNNDRNVNDWDPQFRKNMWWPYNRDEGTAVAVVFVSTEQLCEGGINFAHMLGKMAYPLMHLTVQTVPYRWDQAAANWITIEYQGYDGIGRNSTYATPVPNMVDIAGPYEKVLFVLTDNVWQDNTKMYVDTQALTTRNYVTERWPKNATAPNGNATASALFGLNARAHLVEDGDGEMAQYLLGAIRRWEDSYGHASARNAAMRIAKNFSALFGPPKACIRGYNNGNAAYNGVEVGVVVNTTAAGLTPFWSRNRLADNDWVNLWAWHTLLETPGGDISTADNRYGSTTPNPKAWVDSRPKKVNYTISAPEPCIEFMVERGWLIITEEYCTDRLSTGLQNNAIALREQGIMWAAFNDFLAQAGQINYLHSRQYYLRFAGDPGLLLDAQMYEMLQGGFWPTKLSYFVTGIQFNVPRWILTIKPEPHQKLAIDYMYYNRFPDFLKRSYVPYGRIDQYTASRYNPNIQYNDALLSLSSGKLDYGAATHLFRNPAVIDFVDVCAAHIPKNNSYNLMIRKLTMSFYPEGPEVNENMMIWTCRNAWELQSPFLLSLPTSGLVFSLSYSPWNANILVTSFTSFRSFPVGYQPRSVHPEEGSDAAICFRVRTMRDAFDAIKTNYNILITPTSITAFLLNDMPPSLEMERLFRAQPNLAEDF